MKINKRVQYGLLFVLYITRGGRVTVDSAAEGLSISKSFLEQIARELRLSGVVKSIRGPTGGYELTGEPTVKDIFTALEPVELLTYQEQIQYGLGGQEERALGHYVINLTQSMNPLLNRKIKNVMNELVVNELAQLDKPSLSTLEN